VRSAPLATVLLAATAWAHGAPPQTTGVAPSPWADGGVVVSTTFGLLVTDDRCTWQWLCADHLGLGPREIPTWFAAPSGTLFAATLSGLQVSRDRGCSFTRATLFDDTRVATLAASQGVLFATTSKFGVTNGLARSMDDGRTFEWTTLRAPEQFFSGVQVAPSRPARVYVSSWYFSPKLARLSVSDDRGATFTAVDLPPTVAPGNPFFVHAVDPDDAAVVFASSTNDAVTPERTVVLRSDDGGRTFGRVLEADGRVNGVVRGGARWWVAVGDRVFSSPDGRAFTLEPAPTQRACVGEVSGEVLACGRHVADGYALAALRGEVSPQLKWQQISGPVDCPAGSAAATACAVTWPVERRAGAAERSCRDLWRADAHARAASRLRLSVDRAPGPRPRGRLLPQAVGESRVGLVPMRLAPDEFTGRHYGKYEVLCRLAVGGMAEIFLGFARSGPFVNRPVVLKNILPEQREDPVALQMLLDEARVTATLSHANIAQVVDLERAGEDVLMVIEFIQGANVEEIVEAWTKQGEAVPLGYALTAIREAAQGLAHAHLHKDQKGQVQPIVHRDVTPRNIMTGFDGATKMLDFGIARAMGAQRRTVAGMVRGTTAYMSPEQAVGKDLDPRSDLFSLGIIFHELLTGQRLFYRGNPGAEMAAVYEAEIVPPSRVNRRVPKQLDAVVMKALERNRDKRYQSAVDLIRELSLAAGSTSWAKERCAEMVRDRFAQRRRDMDKLLERVPRETASSTDQHASLQEPSEGRTVMVQRPGAPKPSVLGDAPVRTLIESGPAIAELRERARRVQEEREQAQATGEEPGLPTGVRIPPMPVEPKASRISLPPVGSRQAATPDPLPARPSTPQPQPARPSTPPPQPARPSSTPPPQASLSAESLFGDLDESAERTRVLQGQGRMSLRSLQSVQTDPARNAVAPSGGGSRAPLIIAVLLALILGAGGGVLLYSRMAKQSAGFGRLSLKTDRPATVVLMGQVLGPTPLETVVPAGAFSFQLKEEDGTVRVLLLEVGNDAQVNKTVTLDSLPKAP
jgi:serine/threonine protein kinase